MPVTHNWMHMLLLQLKLPQHITEVIYSIAIVAAVLIIGGLLLKTIGWLINRVFNAAAKVLPVTINTIAQQRRLRLSITRIVSTYVVVLLFNPEFVAIEWLSGLIEKAASVYIMVNSLLLINFSLDTGKQQFNQSNMAKELSIDAFVQVAKLIATVVISILIIAEVINQSPVYILSGLGALTAVLIIVFKDTLLGLVAGFQLAANRMIRNGDWIELPQYGADGNVEEIGLTTVKIKNFDNTISTVPTYELVNKPVKNWRGMEESSGRRIKRSLFINVHSIRFLCDDDIERLSELLPLQSYAQKKRALIQQSNQHLCETDTINVRRLTNIGMFRAYMEHYLHQHPDINQNMTLMVRQLEPSAVGIPLQVYCFCKNKNWVPYEHIQSDIFDHLLSMLSIFELEAFQNISDIKITK